MHYFIFFYWLCGIRHSRHSEHSPLIYKLVCYNYATAALLLSIHNLLYPVKMDGASFDASMDFFILYLLIFFFFWQSHDSQRLFYFFLSVSSGLSTINLLIGLELWILQLGIRTTTFGIENQYATTTSLRHLSLYGSLLFNVGILTKKVCRQSIYA